MKKLGKIAIVIDRLNVGGVEKIAIEQARALRNLGQDAYLVVLRRKGIIDDAFSDLRKNLPTIYLDDRLPKFLKFSLKFPVFNFFSLFHITYPFLIPFVVKKNEFNYAIVHGTYTAFTAVTLRKIKKTPYSVFIWDPIGYILERVYSKKLSILINIFKMAAKFLDRRIINNSDYILVGGSAHNKYIRKINPKTIIKIIPPSVHPMEKPNKTKDDYILMVTAWKRGKNAEYVFEILKKIPDLKVKLVGKWLEPAYKREFLNSIKKEEYLKNIDVVGEVTEKQLSNYYAKAAALLQINDDRGFGMPALEAAAHGTTFIIPEGQGVCALFKNNSDGFFTKEKETDVIAKHISMLMKSKTLALKMGRNAWRTARNNASWETHAKELIKISNAKIN
jgi:glycosyltransferase involved in cell wall biosynthesis